MRPRLSLPWSVLAGALALTGAVAWWLHGIERSESSSRFERMVNARVGDLDASVDHFEVYLRGISGLVASSARLSRQEWAAYIGSLELASRRDPFVSFGYAPVIESRDVPAFVAAMRRGDPGFKLEPAPAPGRRAVPVTLREVVHGAATDQARAAGTRPGDDLLADSRFAEAIGRAEKTRKPALTRRVDVPAGAGAGAMLFLPVYRNDRLTGFAHLLFRIDDLVRGAIKVESAVMRVAITDNDGAGESLYGDVSGRREGALYYSVRSYEFGGRHWTLRFESTPQLEDQLGGGIAITVLVFGALGSFLLFGLVRVLSGTRRRAEEIAERTTKALSDQMKLTEDLIELNPMPIFRKDAEGRYLQFNLAWERLTGFTRADWIGKTSEALFGADQGERFSAQERDLAADPDHIERVETTITGADGSVYDVLVSKAAVRRADGSVAGTIGTITDLTETRRLIAQNDYQREQLALVNQSAQAGVWDIELPLGTAYFSPRYYEMLGYATASGGLPGARSELVHPDDRARVEAAREAHFNGTQPYFDCEYRLRRADGTYLWVNGRGLASLDGAGNPVRFTGSIIDITQRRLAQLEIEHQREQMALVIESVQAGVWDDDLVGGSVYFSPRYREILGFAADADLGAHAHDPARFHPEDRAVVHDARETAIREALPLDLEFRMRHADGSWVWVNARAKASYDVSGFAVRFTGAIIDITKRKEAEFALREANLRALEAAQVKSTFLATMSHEIRTPLNGVIGSAGLLQDTRMTPEQQDYVETIRMSGVQLLTLIGDILDYSKIESGRMELEDEPFDVASVIEDAFDLIAERARGKRLELLYDVAPEVPQRISGDITRLRQVLINLVGNAVKFTEAGEVYVNCAVASGDPASGAPFTLCFRVRDTGIGIAPDKLQRLFTPFMQVDASTTRKYGGTGLGLAISQRLVELMGGSVRVESEAGQGSTFEFTLRTRRAKEDPAGNRQAREIGSIAGKRILIVDDYPSNRRILAAQCANWGLWTVETASVREAMEAIQAGTAADTPFDAIITDMLMPEEDGLDLARQVAALRAAGGPRLPVLALSSAPRAEAFAGREVPEGWFEAYLLKPARQTQLFNALLDVLAPERPFHLTGPESVARPGAMQAYSGKLRILLAEDNEINQKIALRMLERLGKSATLADDGRKALDGALGGGFDCVLMDVQMPELDGLEATRRIRATMSPAQRPYIIAMTANAMAGDRETCLEAGMDDYISKPVQMQLLADALARAQQFLARREASADTREQREAAAAVRDGAAAPVPERHGLPTLDMAQIDELIGLDDSGEVLADFIGMYTTQAPKRIDEIAQALAGGDFTRLTQVAHSLKGASGNLGAVAVADVARRIELAGQTGKAEGLDAMIGEIRERYGEADAALRALPGASAPA